MAVSSEAHRTEPDSPRLLQTYGPELDQGMRRALDGGDSGLLPMLRYHMGWADESGALAGGTAGKELRPRLCLLACEAVGGRADQALPGAVALELVHNFSLIHDDIQDGDTQRHHRATVWALWGKPQGLVAGNAMRALADLTALSLRESGVPPHKVHQVLWTLTQRYLEMIEGQYLDLSFEERLDVRTSEYLEMVTKKTGALMEAAAHVGAFIGTDRSEQVEALRRCGRFLGLAFQARDDELGVWGDQAITGKGGGGDIQRKKKTLPVVYAFEHTSGETRRRLEELYRLPELGPEAVMEVQGVLEELEAQEYVQSVVRQGCDAALMCVEEAQLPSWARERLEELAEFLLLRRY